MKFFRNRPAGLNAGGGFIQLSFRLARAFWRGENQIIPCQHAHLLYLDAGFTEDFTLGAVLS
jgi:hypothetical protein